MSRIDLSDIKTIDEANAVIEELGQALKDVKDLRRQMTVPEPIKRLATALHGKLCHYDHTEGCAWEYEEEWATAVPVTEMGKGIWYTPGRAHHRWAESANAMNNASTLTIDSLVEAVTVMPT